MILLKPYIIIIIYLYENRYLSFMFDCEDKITLGICLLCLLFGIVSLFLRL